MGLEKVVSELDWYGKAYFNEENAHHYVPWKFVNATSGNIEEGGGKLFTDYLTFLKVKGAGLKVHIEKPELMNDLLK